VRELEVSARDEHVRVEQQHRFRWYIATATTTPTAITTPTPTATATATVAVLTRHVMSSGGVDKRDFRMSFCEDEVSLTRHVRRRSYSSVALVRVPTGEGKNVVDKLYG